MLQREMNFYSCPNCHKEISGPLDTEYSMWSFGMGAIIKDKCPFCGIQISLKWMHYLFSLFISLTLAGVLLAVALLLYNLAPEKLRIPVGAALIAFSLFSYYIFSLIFMPKMLGALGVTLYKYNKRA